MSERERGGWEGWEAVKEQAKLNRNPTIVPKNERERERERERGRGGGGGGRGEEKSKHGSFQNGIHAMADLGIEVTDQSQKCRASVEEMFTMKRTWKKTTTTTAIHCTTP